MDEFRTGSDVWGIKEKGMSTVEVYTVYGVCRYEQPSQLKRALKHQTDSKEYWILRC